MWNIGVHIKHFRKERGMTQEEVAKRLGVSGQAVSKWENHINAPDISLLPSIAALFGVSIDMLFSDDETIE